jgi:hypothetical protein
LEKAGRSRQQAMVKSHNGLMSKLITRRQAEEEQERGEPASEWINDLLLAIDAINEVFAEDSRGLEPLAANDMPDAPVCKKST